MIRKCAAFFLLSFVICSTTSAQFYPTQYRPPNQQWQFLQTPHFKFVYGKGNYSSAMRMARILESQYPQIQRLVGGSLENFPVILNDYNDRSNGFVAPLHFRSEIELPPIKGKTINPQTGNWLQSVGPHELVHALQFSHLGEYNLPRFISIFSPDIARSFHGAIPIGMMEGIAVHYETKGITVDGGRGNFPIFTNQFDAIFTGRRWSLGQMMHSSTYTRPFGRHYIGGYEFTAWLQSKFGPETTREALAFYMDFPFLGYGIALRHVTELWPGELYNRFEDSYAKLLHQKKQSSRVDPLNIPLDGRAIRRPKWLSDSTLIFYGSFYNARPGFYTYNLASKKMDRLIATGSVGDYQYDLSADKSELIYSYFESDPIYDYTYKTELVRYNLSSGRRQQITDDDRLYAPVFIDDSLLALQTRPASSRLVSVKTAGDSLSVRELLNLGGDQIIAVAENPVNDQLAIVVNKGGLQALWIAEKSELSAQLHQQPEVAFSNGSVFDPHWHPKGEKLMFSSGFTGVHQLYEYDLQKETIIQITDASFNALEGAYSPDGNRVAFIQQIGNERLPAVIERAEFSGELLAQNLWENFASVLKHQQQSVVTDSVVEASQTWKTGEYKSGLSWLKPRTLLPVVEDISNSDNYGVGLAMYSNDLLQSQAYAAEITYLEKRLWYDVTYHNKTFYPGFKLGVSSDPSYFSFQASNGSINALLRQERSLSLSVPFQFLLNQNVFSTSVFIEPEIRRSQIRFFETSAAANPSDFAHVTIGSLRGQLNYRIQQNIRDLQPNTGLILFGELEHYFNADAMAFEAYGSTIQFNLTEPTALSAGIFTYLSPFRQWNQSLRIGLEGITQTGLIFDTQSIVSEAFSEPAFIGSKNLLNFSTRYTIPLFYVDNGGFLLPLYLSNIYLVGFSNTVISPARGDWLDNSRSVFGLGIRARFRVSNLAFDIGIGLGFEPTRGNKEFFLGDF